MTQKVAIKRIHLIKRILMYLNKIETPCFPDMEFFLLHRSDPAATGDTPTALFPPMEKKINVSGNSKDLIPVDEEVEF
ncbi:hypothetical protein QW060_16305 [Myroides ceti]|uniref:Uncharacterized protein n=1 Tax=Paenimyroides ceti TaxID=395087 RepID=A0ABT8CW27_9FLAO|nr:hypothetical protein [Paenimyroides ceti]MDN3708665.1 hypothetical protein [Paenimyroides ceti]